MLYLGGKMKRTLLFLTILVFILLAACDNEKMLSPVSDTSEHPYETSNQGAESTTTSYTEESFLSGSDFPNTNDFLVHNFQVTYDESNHSMHYLVDYSFGETPLNHLVGGKHRYYFKLEIPAHLTKYFTNSNTNPVQGPLIMSADKTMKYQVELSAKLNKNTTKLEINDILTELEEYSLVLYENKDYPAKKVVGVKEFSEVK